MLSKLLPTLRSALVCILSLAATASVAQTTINVGPGQSYTTIQSGINAAANGDTVVVAPGTYYENIDFLGKAITVTSSAGAATTIIDGSIGQSPTVIFHNKESSTSILNGFTIQGGGAENYLLAPSNGGISIQQGSPVISNNIITHNHCNDILSSGSSPLIQNNEIDNTLDAKGGCGFAGGSAIWLSGSLSYYNGGSQIITPPATVIGNLIQNNTQSGRDDAGGNGGTGVAVWGAYAAIIGNTIRNNLTLGDGGAILAFNTDDVTVIGNLIYGNQAGTDGAISLLPPDDTVGPFIGIVASNTIYGNTATSTTGGWWGDAPSAQVYLSGNLGQYLLVNNIIIGSGSGTVSVACGTIYNYLSLTPLVFDHNDLYNPGGNAYGGSCPNQTGTYGNISADPVFVNPSAGNFQLALTSPAVDTGNNSAPQLTATDLAGNPRVADATGKGYPIVDMGAFELAGQQDAAPTILTLTPSQFYYPAQFTYYNSNNTPLVFTITLASTAGTPTGPVTLYEDGNAFATVLVGPSGTATQNGAGLTPGLHAFTATYPGSGIFPAAVSVKFYLWIPLYATNLTIVSTPNPSIFGTTVNFSIVASSSDGTILSPITLTDTSTNTPLSTLTPNSAGQATYSTSALAVGYHSITAAYAGDSTHNAASASVSQSVINGYASSTSLTCSPNPILQYGTALFSATVTSSNGIPTGSISFTDNGAALGQPALGNGSASLTYTGQTAGTHTIVATYLPTGSFGGSSSTCLEVVQAKPSVTTLVSSLNPSNAGQSVTFTATTTYGGPPQNFAGLGSITFADGGVPLQTVNLTATGATGSGSASFSIGTLIAGSHSITATLNPLAGYAASSAALTQVVNGIPSTAVVTANPASAVYGSPITLTATVAAANPPGLGTPGGPVNFLDGGTPIGSGAQLNSSGVAQLQVSTLLPGTHVITAQYPGSSTYTGSTSAAVQVIVTGILTSTTLAAAPNPSYPNQPVTFTATISNSASQAVSGSVTFLDGATPLGTVTVNSSGTASLATSSLSIGTHPITANYLGNGTLLPSQSNVVQQVVLDSSFSLAVTPATMSLQTQHHTTFSATITPLGTFSGTVTLSCGPLPQHSTCLISPASVSLSANGGPQSASVYLDTSDVIGYARSGPAPLVHSSEEPLFAALFLPSLAVCGLVGARLRRLRHLRLVLFAIGLVAASMSLGCSGKYPDSVAPGTYNLLVTGTANTGSAQNAPITLTVTP
jgi:hypothetical protein